MFSSGQNFLDHSLTADTDTMLEGETELPIFIAENDFYTIGSIENATIIFQDINSIYI